MRKIYYSVGLYFFIAGVFLAISFAESNWNKEFTKSGISVYTRPVEGSSFKEFKGISMIDSPMQVCQNVLMDVDNLIKWMPDCKTAKLLKTEKNGTVIIAYNETKAPWPVSNRDVVTRSNIIIEKERIVHNVIAIDRPDLVPLTSGKVRITKMIAQWVLIQKGNKTMAIYQVKADPGGAIPSWLANSASKDLPYKTLLGLRSMVKNPKYQIK